MKKPPVLLIDADYFFYRAAAAAEEEHEYSPDLTVIVGSFRRGKDIVRQEFAQLTERFGTQPGGFILTFTDEASFRKEVDPSYKGNRVKRKPAGYLKLKNWAKEEYKVIIRPGLEADDCMGILATNGWINDFILVSPDKDMQQIECRIFDLKTVFVQDRISAFRKLYEQCLSGDQTDGYKGCPGIGPKRAHEILSKVDDKGKKHVGHADYWAAVVEAYDKAGLTYDDALTQLRLAKILQADDWNSIEQKPILFDPTK